MSSRASTSLLRKLPPPTATLIATKSSWGVWVGLWLLWAWGSSCLAGGTEQRSDFPAGLRLLDLDGRAVDPLGETRAKATVFIFVSVECPISNSYMPEYRRLKEEFSPKGIAIRLVYAAADEAPQAIRRHLKEHGCPVEAWRDPRHDLVKATGVRVTPEAAVIMPGRGLVYHGRIDDRYVELGKARPTALKHDLREVLKDILDGNLPRPRTAPAIGCYIPGVT
jgi:hypothetical protein